MTAPLTPRRWTIDDLSELPDDGNRHELHDGSLFVTPTPEQDHGDTTEELARILRAAVPDHLRVWTTPSGVELKTQTTYFVPDLLVLPARGRRPGTNLSPSDVLLVVEVVSRGTRRRDVTLKRREYAAVGIPDYWIVDRWRRRLTVLSLEPGQSEYTTATDVEAGTRLRVERPFAVELDPADFCVTTW